MYNKLETIICNTVGGYLCMGAKERHPNENYNDKEEELTRKLAKAIEDKFCMTLKEDKEE